MRKKLALLVILLTISVLFTGCKKKQEETNVASPTSFEEEMAGFLDVESPEEQPEEESEQTSQDGQPNANTAAKKQNDNGNAANQNKANTSAGSGQIPNNTTAATTAQQVNNNCTISISCTQVLSHMDKLPENKKSIIPASGLFLGSTNVEIQSGDTAYDVLLRVTRQRGIHLDSTYTAMYGSAYIKGIGNLYEFDCGSNSGWLYSVNGSTPSYGCSKYKVQKGDNLLFYYKVG